MSDTPAPKRRRRLRWRGLLSGLLVALVLACVGGTFAARQIFVGDGAAEQAVLTQVVPVERGELVETVQINGALEPADQARLSFAAGARVSEVLVAEGDRVRAGAVLARLETRDLELAVAGRQAELDQAQQALDKLRAGPTEAELAAAAAAVARARANIVAAGAEVRPVDVELARARLAAARERLAALDSGEATDEQTAAQSQLSAAEEALVDRQAAVERARDTASRAKTDAGQALERGVQALTEAQQAYSDAYWDWDFVQRTGRHPREKVPVGDAGRTVNRELEEYEVEQFRRAFEAAGVALHNAEVAVKNLTEAYDQAREDEVEQVRTAERAVTTAERDLDAARRKLGLAGARERNAALLAARRDVAEAERDLDKLVNDPTRPASAAELQAALLEALADDEKLRAGPDAVELAQARTALERARAELARAETELEEAALRAPIAGTVVAISLKPGTTVGADDAIRIADLSAFRIRGRVTEQSVARVSPGQSASVRIDSLPELSLDGALARVAELPEEDPSQASGGFGPPGAALGGLYPVEITIRAADPRLRVGMAATAEIAVLSIPDALIIPLQAVEGGPDGPAVRRVAGPPGPDGQPASELVPVELGQSSGDRVQVLTGLREGDELLLPQLPPMDGPPGVVVGG